MRGKSSAHLQAQSGPPFTSPDEISADTHLETCGPPVSNTPAPHAGPSTSLASSRGVFDGGLEEKASQAIISVNTFNIIDPPRPLKFGKFNPRPLSNPGVKELAESFLEDGFMPFKQESMIPILLNVEDIDESCISKDFLLGGSAPPLKLKDGPKNGKGKARVTKIDACGGNHRLSAVKKIRADADREIKRLESQIGVTAKAKGKRKQKEEVVDAEPADIPSLRQKIAELEVRKTSFITWGVIVYDARTFYFFS
ncbi:hypothetical protein P691DRAFT_681969 [Macrolepiota fuliginosa MF-IS2]|uniref:Uncharacterized protein n=1 Tax=Macrolepiota fuliginosa MF-IS2 TaxID=1400762 RepID=A0A9P6BVV1_9AGAR|nr:hypothetical protein P691DRAFT_681969 [Macrolepiota fuliginosa MF-IS2]